MKIEYALTFADYRAAMRLIRRRIVGRMVEYIVLERVIPLLAIIVLAATILFAPRWNGHPAITSSRFFIILLNLEPFFLTISIFALAGRFFGERKNFKSNFPSARTDRNSHIDIDDERIVTGIPGVSETKYTWAGIRAFIQDERITMFYVDRGRFVMIPTPALSRAQHTELDDLVARHAVRRKPC